MDDRLSLAALGRELDSARRARSGDSALEMEESDDLTPLGLSSTILSRRSPSASSSVSASTVSSDESIASLSSQSSQERPYPLCLLCLTRPPSAVLLPCCHLNLCHLCAPLLLLKHRSSSPSQLAIVLPEPPSSATPAHQSSQSPERPSWNTVLARATANHPKSRRLSMGGYLAPEISKTGGEMMSADVLPPYCEVMPSIPDLERSQAQKQEQEKEKESRTGMTRRFDEEDDGRVALGLSGTISTGSEAKCLMCRTSVRGWLRVYTG